MKSKIEEIKEVEDWRNRSLKKSKIEEVEDWKKSKIWNLETQPESATQVESRGLLTWVYPSGTHRLVYRGPAHYGGGLVQGLKDWLRDKERKFQYVFD
jgi:hypothetical protein